MKYISFVVLLSLAFNYSQGAPNPPPEFRGTPVQVQLRRVSKRAGDGTTETAYLKVDGEGHNYEINLQSTPSKIFSPNFQYTVATLDSSSQPILVPRNTPSLQEKIQEVEANMFVDHATDSVVLMKGGNMVEGIVHGNNAILPGGDGQKHSVVTHKRAYRSDVLYANDTMVYAPSTLQQASGPMTVEIQVYLDYDFVQNLNGDQARITEYVAVFFHSVKTRFARGFPNNELSIDIVVAGITQINNRANQPFIENNRESGVDGSVDMDKVINDFGNYIHQGPYDLVVLLIGSGGDQNPVGGTQGVAWGGGICKFDNTRSNVLSAGVNIDLDRYGDYEGVHSTTHEIGHNLGAKHDYMAQDPSSNRACPSEGGYIMGYDQSGGPNHYRFSSCSIADIRKRTSTAPNDCLFKTNAPAPVPISPKWDGNVETFDDICQKELHDPNATVKQRNPDDMCKTIVCCTDSYCMGSPSTVPDYIPCGDAGGKCFEASCQ